MTAEIAMIEEIEKHRCLYDHGMPEYNRKDLTDEAWEQVGAALKLSVHECKDKWKNIRSSFVRSLRKSKRSYYLSAYLHFLLPYVKKWRNNTSSKTTQQFNDDEGAEQPDDDGNDSEKSDTSDQCINVKIEPETDQISDAEMYNDDEEIDETVLSPEPKKAKRKKRKIFVTNPKMAREGGTKADSFQYDVDFRRKNARISDSNAMRFFLLSLLPEFETMDSEQVRIFKIKVMMLIDDIKGDVDQTRRSLRNSSDNERLQKRLINLLLKNLERPS